jgi:2-methylcitrate dehydratase
VDEIVIHTSHHTHRIIGSGSGDPQKYNPEANHETLDHSLMYIFAVALEDGTWHHDVSYHPSRASRPSTVALWHSIRTVEDAYWDARYHHADPLQRAFGGHVVVRLRDGIEIHEEIEVADAHPRGRRPFSRSDYIEKFLTLSSDYTAHFERERFLATTLSLPKLSAGRLGELNVIVPAALLSVPGLVPGLFERRGY